MRVLYINHEGNFGKKYHTAGSTPYHYQECFKNPTSCDNDDDNDKENDDDDETPQDKSD